MPDSLVASYIAEEILAVVAFVASYFLASLVGRSFDGPASYRMYALGRGAATLIVGALGAAALSSVTALVRIVIVGPSGFRQLPTPADARTQMLVAGIAAVVLGALAVFRIESWYRTEVGVAGKRRAEDGETEWRGADESRPSSSRSR